MKQLLFFFLVVVVLALSVAPVSAALPATGICPDGFILHPVEDHDHEHHIGLKTDLNGNGYLCVLMLSDERHVHMDDVIP